MGLFARIFGSTDQQVAVCLHERLMPRWRGPQAMPDKAGDQAEAMGYVCHRCHAELTPFAARELRAMRALAPAREEAP